MENEDVMCDGEIELSDRAKSLWGKTNRVDDTEWLPPICPHGGFGCDGSENLGHLGSLWNEINNIP